MRTEVKRIATKIGLTLAMSIFACFCGSGARQGPEAAPASPAVPIAERDAGTDGGAEERSAEPALPDRDGDRIPDAYDLCPDECEVYNGLADSDGCPDQGGGCIGHQPPERTEPPPGVSVLARGCSPCCPDVAWNGEDLGVAWSDVRDGCRRILFARLAANGAMLGEPVRLTIGQPGAYWPRLAWSDDGWGLTFARGSHTGDVPHRYFMKLSRLGEPVGTPQLLTENGRWDGSTDLAWTGTAFAVIFDEAARTGESVFLQLFDGAGKPLGEKRLLSSPESAVNRQPAIAWNGNQLGVAWIERGLSYQSNACHLDPREPEPEGCRTAVHLERLDAEGARFGETLRLELSYPEEPRLLADGPGFALAVAALGSAYLFRIPAAGDEVPKPTILAPYGGCNGGLELVGVADGHVLAWKQDGHCSGVAMWRAVDGRGEAIGEEFPGARLGGESYGAALARTSCGTAAAWTEEHRDSVELRFRYLDATVGCASVPDATVDADLEPGCPGRRVWTHPSSIRIMHKAFFPRGGESLRAEDLPILDRVAETLIHNPQITRIQVAGHASGDEGSAERKIRLGRQRAEAVLKYLVKKGVKRESLGAAGYGDLCPMHDNREDTEKTRGANRRVEFSILVIDGVSTNDRFACDAAVAKGLVPKEDRKYLPGEGRCEE